ncbi:MAG: glycosyltransferase family 39 protein [Alphaproteobacteria bacterium]|nr:glycosyltransferase family 39 protein [Alphaproteobacteria bacterium]
MITAYLDDRRSALAALDRFDALTVALLGALTFVALATYGDFAISNDEEVQQRYGELIVAYYASGFADQAALGFRNLYLYGGLFDVVATLLGRAVPSDPWQLRHLLCALSGIGGIAATAASARLIAGPRAGFLAAVALAVCGVWFGGMFNHTKDVPFAAAMIGATYFLLRIARELPRPRMRHVAGFGILAGAALGLRAYGLLLLAYAGLAILMRAASMDGREWPQRIRFAALGTVRLLPAAAIAYVIMVAAWPWAALELSNPVKAIWVFAHFNYQIRTLLAGEVYLMDAVPRWYVPTYILIKLPLIVLAGALAAMWALARPKLAGGGVFVEKRREIALLAATASFPVLCTVILHGPAFTGMRHFLYVVPPIAVLAGVGLDGVLAALERAGGAAATAAMTAVTVGFSWNAIELARLHPHQYLFFNALVGGLEGASRRYDTDYWVNIMPEAAKGLDAYVRSTGGDPARRHTVAVCGERLAFERTAGPRFVWTGDWLGADFFIAPTHMDCDRVLKGKVAFTIERLGVVIGVVQDLRGLGRYERDFIEFRDRPPAHAGPAP